MVSNNTKNNERWGEDRGGIRKDLSKTYIPVSRTIPDLFMFSVLILDLDFFFFFTERCT